MNRKRGRPPSPREGAKEAVAEITAAKKLLGISENELAAKVGLNQSTVNRLLKSPQPAWTPSLHVLCNYVKNVLRPETPGTAGGKEGEKALLAALLNVWDGTASGAARLINLLRSVDEIRRAPSPARGAATSREES